MSIQVHKEIFPEETINQLVNECSVKSDQQRIDEVSYFHILIFEFYFFLSQVLNF